MTAGPRRKLLQHRRRLGRALAAACCVLALSAAIAGGPSKTPAEAASSPPAVRTGGPSWASLTPAQQSALAPLQRDWGTLESSGKSKWLEVAARLPSLAPDERQRVQDRMAEWARMTPAERGRARQQFQEARQIGPESRQERWDAYQALPADQRRALADRSAPPASGAKATKPEPRLATAASAPEGKRNFVSVNTASTAAARPISPTAVQAKPGATTTLMSQPAVPPPHHQPGLPKITATEGFVNRSTLLPQRGPQGAAVRGEPAASAAKIGP